MVSRNKCEIIDGGRRHSPLLATIKMIFLFNVVFTHKLCTEKKFSLTDSSIMRPNGTPKPLNDNGDLWWSVLGGGGGTYGVVTQFKVKLHEAPRGGFINLFLNFNVFDQGPCAGAAVEVGSHLRSL